jgi:hypothetical protein
VDPEPSNRQTFTDDELKEATLHSSQISPMFGDIAAKMELAGKREVQRLVAMGAPIIVDRGNGVEELCSLPDDRSSVRQRPAASQTARKPLPVDRSVPIFEGNGFTDGLELPPWPIEVGQLFAI